jgi:hypothetical protein
MNFLQVLIAVVFVFLVSGEVSSQTAKRIEFYRNSTDATVSSSLRSYKDRKLYVVKVRQGQTLKIEQIKDNSAARSITVSIKNPSGKIVAGSDSSCNNRQEIAPTVAGDYTITVYECLKTDARRGRFRLKVTVK